MTARLVEVAGKSTARVKGCMLAGALLAFAVSSATAQYEVREWANFEDGKLPENVITIGGGWQNRMQVVATDSATTQAPAFRNEEVGKNVLRLQTIPRKGDATSWQVGLAVGDVVDRTKLGPKGRALFQADFYVEENGRFPSIAVMAMEPPKNMVNNHVDSIAGSFYRFGITKGDRLYFSQVIPGGATAPKYEQDKELLAQLPRPGWHRFAIVCEGSDTIRCFVDGREAAFSPLKDTAMTQVMVGMLLAEQDAAYATYADNLSIQISDDAPALPASPYDSGWGLAAGSSSKAKSTGAITALPTAKVTTALASDWLPPVQAWKKAQTDKQGLLLYFYAPGVSRVEKVNQMLQTDAAAKAYMARHACARVDVNQLEGGSIAKKYNIFKVPTFLVISPDAQSFKQISPGASDTWQQIESQLAPL